MNMLIKSHLEINRKKQGMNANLCLHQLYISLRGYLQCSAYHMLWHYASLWKVMCLHYSYDASTCP